MNESGEYRVDRQMTTSTIIGILGMHRSGTSCLTGCLESYGLHLGEVKTENWDNLQGNRESLELRKINDSILAFNQGYWHRPPDTLLWNDELRQRRDQALQARQSHSLWGFKDPRTLLTLPFWLEAIPDLKMVGTFRHPHAVARSLSERNKMPENQSISLWKIYNEKLLGYAKQYGFPLISFDLTPQRYQTQVEHIVVKLGINANQSSTAESFFNNDLRRHSESDSADLPPDIQSLYNELIGLSNKSS